MFTPSLHLGILSFAIAYLVKVLAIIVIVNMVSI